MLHLLDLPDDLLDKISFFALGRHFETPRRRDINLFHVRQCDRTDSKGILSRELCLVHSPPAVIRTYHNLRRNRCNTLHGDDLVLSPYMNRLFFSHKCCSGRGEMYRIFDDYKTHSLRLRCVAAEPSDGEEEESNRGM